MNIVPHGYTDKEVMSKESPRAREALERRRVPTALATVPGRIYTIGIVCTDAVGNSTRKTVTVVVPHDV